MLLFPPETRALCDLVAGLRLLVGVLPSGVPLPLSLSRSPRSLSRAPEGGIASSICSMLENPGAQIDADLVFRRSELSAILLELSSLSLSYPHYPYRYLFVSGCSLIHHRVSPRNFYLITRADPSRFSRALEHSRPSLSLSLS